MYIDELRKYLCNIIVNIFNDNGINNIFEFNKKYIIDFDYLIDHILFETYYLDYFENEKMYSLRFHLEQENKMDMYRGITKFYGKWRNFKDDQAKQNSNGGELYGKYNVRYKVLSDIAEKLEGQKLSKVDYRQLIRIYKYSLFIQIYKQRIFDNKKVSNQEFINYLDDLDKVYDEFESIDCRFEKCMEYYQLELSCGLERLYRISEELCNENILDDELIRKVCVLFKYRGKIINPDDGSVLVESGDNRFLLTNNDYLKAILTPDISYDVIANEVVFMNALRNKVLMHIKDLLNSGTINLVKDYNNDIWNIYSKDSLYNNKQFYRKDGKINNKLIKIIRQIQNS